MKQSVYVLCLSLGLGLMAQTSHTAVVKNTHTAVKMTPAKPSLIEKALLQQKEQLGTAKTDKLQADNDLKMMTSIKAAPTQSFFASQNQRFSRFVQSFFSSNQS
ncbi:hypothetical protein [Acinetobacter indicus]|uniref:hypothetical protein n=1 Tax=Acinetobacter indicus TaxID=756892 RepID=UPI00143FDDE0|nr:hypothetical protein [Acinetobacter indicus]MDM1292234.1 hypothetical protein [Acinetobacter indicus]MDM1322257.1 hypothetical protein [Acinetobacter indicus]MDM1334000.1 hypothetical protein [Acinetobacter indicus]QIZ59307.1 hypothetical protein FK537_09345 [Acinetobacter indicus]